MGPFGVPFFYLESYNENAMSGLRDTEHDYQYTARCGEVICEDCFTEKYIAPFNSNEQMFEFDHSEE